MHTLSNAQQTAPGDPLVGSIVADRYRVDALLGEGGVGRVYRARHAALGRAVALKVLLPQHDSGVFRARFRREADALAGLSHPNVVAISDFGVHEDTPFFVMELLEGCSLAELIEEKRVSPPHALAIMRQILLALGYAHARGVVHRDLKPQNVFVRRLDDGTHHVTVLDFGLARFVGRSSPGAAPLTRSGMWIGTPAYMAPEQASGDAAHVDARSDVYSAGLLLFELLSGRRPFLGSSSTKLMRAHLLEDPPSLAEADPSLRVTPALEELVSRALAKRAADRFADATEMLAALDALEVRAAPSRATRRNVPAIAIGALGVLAAGIVLATPRSIERPPPPPAALVAPPAPAPIVVAPDPAPAPLPDRIAALSARVEDGHGLTRAQVRVVRAWAREEGDVRAHLLLARAYTNERALSWALPEYEAAMARDPSVRADPGMLPDLLEMVRSSSLSRRASDAVAEWYGPEAIEAAEESLRDDPRPEERRRLERLLTRLRAL